MTGINYRAARRWWVCGEIMRLGDKRKKSFLKLFLVSKTRYVKGG